MNSTAIVPANASQLARQDAQNVPPALAYLATQRTAAGRRTARSRLDTCARILSQGQHDALTLPWAALSPAMVAALGTKLSESYSARSTNAMLAHVRGTLKECWRSEAITAERLARLVDVKSEPVPTDLAGRGLAAGELAALFTAAANDPIHARGARDAALLALLYGAGLRRSEAAAVLVADVMPDAVKVTRGKGRKSRTVPVCNGTSEAIQAWITIRGDEPGPLLTRVGKNGQPQAGGLSDRAIALVVGRLAADAHVRPFTAHDLRRSYVSNLLDAGADLSTVQQLAGHSSPATTARYDRRPAEARQRAAQMLHVPYHRAS